MSNSRRSTMSKRYVSRWVLVNAKGSTVRLPSKHRNIISGRTFKILSFNPPPNTRAGFGRVQAENPDGDVFDLWPGDFNLTIMERKYLRGK